MIHFAKLDETNTVIFVTVGRQEDDGKESELSERTGDRYVQTSHNGTFRGSYAGIGYTYDPIDDRFLAPQPYPSWTLDDAGDWQPPTPYPDGDGMYMWDEETLTWEATDA